MIFTNFTLHATLATQSLCRLHPSRPSRLVRYGKKNAWHKASPTSWPCWRSRYRIRQHRRISVGTSWHGAALGHCGHRLFRFSMCHSEFRRTDIGKRFFSCAALATWNSLPPAVINCDTLSVFKSRLKTHLFNTAYTASLPVPPAPLKLRHYGALQMFYYYYYYYYYYYVRPGFESTKKDVQLWMSMFMKPPTKLNCLRKREPSEWKNVSK